MDIYCFWLPDLFASSNYCHHRSQKHPILTHGQVIITFPLIWRKKSYLSSLIILVRLLAKFFAFVLFLTLFLLLLVLGMRMRSSAGQWKALLSTGWKEISKLVNNDKTQIPKAFQWEMCGLKFLGLGVRWHRLLILPISFLTKILASISLP